MKKIEGNWFWKRNNLICNCQLQSLEDLKCENFSLLMFPAGNRISIAKNAICKYPNRKN